MTSTHADQAFGERLALLNKAVLAGRYWRLACAGLLGILTLAVCGNIYQGSLPHWMPYYVEIDRCGGDVRVVGPAPQMYTLPELAVRQTVSRFVEGLRAIPTDQEMLKLAWRRADHQVTKEGRSLLAQYEANFKPLTQREPVFVRILSVLPQTELTFSVRWEEQHFSDKLEWRETTVYRGLFTVQKRLPLSEDERRDAPLGLFFHDWHWSRE